MKSLKALVVFTTLALGLGTAQAQMSRTEILDRAKAFVYYPWHASASNLTASCVPGYDSAYVVGDFVGMAYDWGGFDSLFGFDQKQPARMSQLRDGTNQSISIGAAVVGQRGRIRVQQLGQGKLGSQPRLGTNASRTHYQATRISDEQSHSAEILVRGMEVLKEHRARKTAFQVCDDVGRDLDQIDPR